MTAGPSVAVVVVAYGSAEDLPGCLRSIRAGRRGGALEIVVVDNDSPDDTRAALADEDGVRLVEMGRNAGFAAACNRGVAAAAAELICFVNPDARVQEGAIDALVGAAVRRPDHLLYSGKVLDPHGRIDKGCCAALPSLWEYACFATGLSTVFAGTRWFDPAVLGGWDRSDERPVPVVSGAFLLTRREQFLAFGGFDERYFMYSEDVDLSARALSAGQGPLFVPDAVAVHASGGSSTSGAKTVMVLRGKATYVRLRWTPARAGVATALLRVGTFLRAGLSRVSGHGRKWREAWAAREEWSAGW